MCGRFAITLPPQAVRAFFGYIEQPNFPPRYNIAPTAPVAVVRGRAGADGRVERHLDLVRWGFLPPFVKEPRRFPVIFNARCETLRGKASFARAFRRRRCLFIADAFYEWRRETARRSRAGRPYLFRGGDGAPLALGGIWESWSGPNGEQVDTACIITTAANDATAAIHDRLPAIIEPAAFDIWLDTDEETADAAYKLLRPPENGRLRFFEVGLAVNKTDNDGPGVQEPVAETAPEFVAEGEAAPAAPAQGSLF